MPQNVPSSLHFTYSTTTTVHRGAKSAVDGIDIRHSSHELAVRTIKNASDKMMLLVQSLNTRVIRSSFLSPSLSLIKTLSQQNADQTPIDFVKKLPPPPVTPSRTPLPEIIQVTLRPLLL